MKKIILIIILLFGYLSLQGQSVGITDDNTFSPIYLLHIKPSPLYATDLMSVQNNGGTTYFHIKLNGNVGIGTNNPQQKLDIVGNLQFSGSIMPNGDAGINRKVLTSTGPGTVPIWTNPTGMLYDNTYTCSSTASVTATAVNTLVPGLTKTITTTANSLLYIYTDGGVQTTCATTGRGTLIDMTILNNGAWLPQGGFKRIDVQNPSNYIGGFQYWSMGAYVFLPAGTYTITVNTRLSGGCNSAVVGGDNSSVLEGILVIQVIYQ